MAKKQTKKSKYIGIVTSDDFKTKGIHYKKGSEYDCKDKFSYEHLKSIKKIK